MGEKLTHWEKCNLRRSGSFSKSQKPGDINQNRKLYFTIVVKHFYRLWCSLVLYCTVEPLFEWWIDSLVMFQSLQIPFHSILKPVTVLPGMTISSVNQVGFPQPCIFDIITISSIILEDKPLIYRRVRTDQVSRDTGAFTERSKDKHITYIKLLLCAWKEDKYTKPCKESGNNAFLIISASPLSPVIPRSFVASVWRSGHRSVSSGQRPCATHGSTVSPLSLVMALQPAHPPAAAPPPGAKSQCHPTWTSPLVTWYW